MFKTREPVIIMTKDELEALIEQTAKKAAAEALKSFQAWTAARCASNSDSYLSVAEVPARSRERPRNQDRDSTYSGERIIRLPDVEKAVCLKKSAIYQRINPKHPNYDPDFPAPIKLGKHASGWRESAIQAWILKRDSKQPANID